MYSMHSESIMLNASAAGSASCGASSVCWRHCVDNTITTLSTMYEYTVPM